MPDFSTIVRELEGEKVVIECDYHQARGLEGEISDMGDDYVILSVGKEDICIPFHSIHFIVMNAETKKRLENRRGARVL